MEERKFSNSELQTFKRCRRKWYLAYYRRLALKAPKLVGPLAIGNRVHDALAAYYVPSNQTAVDPRTTFRSGVEADLDDFPDEHERIEKDGELGIIMLDGYLDWLEETGADANIEVIAPEEAIEKHWGTVDGVDLTFMGKLDIRVRDVVTGARRWLDHKTTNDMQTPVKIAYLDEQFKSYSLLERLDAQDRGDDDWADGGIINILKRVKRTASAKPPFYVREHITYNKFVLEDIWTRIMETLADVVRLTRKLDDVDEKRRATVAYPTPNKNCTWDCDFFPVCPMMDENPSAAEAFISDYYAPVDPYERYKEETTTD